MLDLLETFCAVVDAGSLSRAAERLHRTQPSVTRQVQALERQLGAVLVTRTPRGVELTPAGQAVLPHARAALAAVRACQEEATAASAAPARLRLAAGLMAMQYVLPPLISRLRQRHPDISVELQPAHQRVAVTRLLGYEVDAAVIASPVRSAQVRAFPLLRDPLLLVTAPPRPEGTVRLEDLAGMSLLVLAAGTGLYELVAAALNGRSIACTLVEHPTAETIKTAVALGMGAAILPESAVRAEVRAGILAARRFTGWPQARRTISLLIRATGHTPPAAAALLALAQEGDAGNAGDGE